MDYISLDKNSSIPLHQQLFVAFRMAIRSGSLKPGEKLPTEEELCQFFSISRPVVRHAYNRLIEEELIYRHKGRGTFVLFQKAKYTILQSLSSLTKQIRLNNMNPTIVDVGSRFIECTSELADKLELSEKVDLFLMRRMYYGNDEPQFYIELYVPVDLYPNMQDLKTDQALADFVKIHGISESVLSKKHITAVKFDHEICHLFNLPENSVGFKIEASSYAANGRIMEYSYTYMKGLGTSMGLDYFSQL